jgi:zinc protease
VTRIIGSQAVPGAVALVLCGLCWAGVYGQVSRPDRSAPPALGSPPSLTPPVIQEHRLSNGLRVWMVEMRELPVAQTMLVVRAGANGDPAGRFGVASLTAAMLDEGAGGRSALQIADDLEFLGASLETFSSFDGAGVSMWVPVARWTPAVRVMADVARRPTFPTAELERVRQELLTSIVQSRDDAEAVADEAFARAVYGSSHRYGAPVPGSPAAAASLSGDEIRRFYAAHYRPDNACLVVVGDLEPAAVKQVLEEEFGNWTSTGSPGAPVSVPAMKPARARRVVIVDMPGAEQSEIRIGWSGPARSTPDYFPLVVMNTILGEFFTSRLNTNLREQHGYAYGAYSRFSLRRHGGPFVAGAGVETAKTAEAITEFFREIGSMAKPIAAGELERARNYIALGLPATFETVGDVSARLRELLTLDLPLDYFGSYVARINGVTESDARRVARRYLMPDQSLVLIAGDRAAIEARVRALRLGPVTTMTVDEALGPMPHTARR